MEFIKEWTFSICVSLIAAVILSLFTPKGSLKKFYKILLSFFIVVSFLYPLKDLDTDFIDLENLNSGIEAKIESNMQTSMQHSVDNQIKTVLTQNGIMHATVESDISFVNNEITVNHVQIAVSDEYDVDAVSDVVFDEIGIKAKVIHIGE